MVLWIGGPPGAGKTTVARRLARRHGLHWYGADTRTWAHRDRALAAGVPAAVRWEALDPGARWAAPAAELLAMSLHRERGAMIADDLRGATGPTVAEGTPVTPAVAGGRAVWLLPTPAVQRARLAERVLPEGVRTLYRLLVGEIAREVAAQGRRVVVVDGRRGVDETVAEVEDALALPPHPTAAPSAALLREGNDTIAEQYRAGAARPWATATAAVVTFACECARPGCVADVDLPVSSPPPRLAPGH